MSSHKHVLLNDLKMSLKNNEALMMEEIVMTKAQN